MMDPRIDELMIRERITEAEAHVRLRAEALAAARRDAIKINHQRPGRNRRERRASAAKLRKTA